MPQNPHPAAREQKSHLPSGAYAALVASRASAPVVYTPPAGFPADPAAWLAYLEAGVLTTEQIKYLQSNALQIYVAGIESARGVSGAEADVALGDKIIAVWRELLQRYPAPVGVNPFNP